MVKGKLMVKSLFIILLALAVVFSAPSCKQQSTIPETPDMGLENVISLSCSPSSGGTGTEVTVTISVTKNKNEIKAFGFEMTFDAAVFQLQKVEKGVLTSGWAAVDGNETTPGSMITGGFMGSGTAVAPGSTGILAQIKFKVIYSGNDDGFTRQLAINNYSDNLVGMKPEPASTSFTYNK